MARVISNDAGVPIHVWARRLPDEVLKQLRRIAAEPYVVDHVAAMPDVHVASGVAVGTVFATDGVVVPSALGGDLGCGMSALRFDLPAAQLSGSELERILSAIESRIPLGDATHRGKRSPLPAALLDPLSTGALEHERERLGAKQLGTLGGGNHFIELDRDAGGDLWLLVHSGSRGLGGAIASHHQRVAERSGVGTIRGLLTSRSEGSACLQDVEWALRFAKANRDAMVDAATQVLAELTVAGGSRWSTMLVTNAAPR